MSTSLTLVGADLNNGKFIHANPETAEVQSAANVTYGCADDPKHSNCR
jgi:hypothetical protein